MVLSPITTNPGANTQPSSPLTTQFLHRWTCWEPPVMRTGPARPWPALPAARVGGRPPPTGTRSGRRGGRCRRTGGQQQPPGWRLEVWRERGEGVCGGREGAGFDVGCAERAGERHRGVAVGEGVRLRSRVCCIFGYEVYDCTFAADRKSWAWPQRYFCFAAHGEAVQVHRRVNIDAPYY